MKDILPYTEPVVVEKKPPKRNGNYILPDPLAQEALRIWNDIGQHEAMAYLSRHGYGHYSYHTLRQRARRAGIRPVRRANGGRNWTLREEDVIRLYYSDHTCPPQFILEKLAGRNWEQVKVKACRMGILRGTSEERKYEKNSSPRMPVIESTAPILILSDLHIPYHDEKWIERAVGLASAWSASRVLLVGDTIDLDTHSPSGRASDESYEEAHRAYTLLEARLLADFEKVDVILAPYSLWTRPRTEGPGPAHVRIVERTYVRNVDRVTAHDSFGFNINKGAFYVEHPGTGPRGNPVTIADYRGASVAVAHTHRSTLDHDKSGRLVGIRIGAAANHARLPGCGRIRPDIRRDQGALILVPDGRRWRLTPHLLTPDMPLEEMRMMYREGR